MIEPPATRVLIDEATLRTRVRALGDEISRDYAGREILLIGVLKGAVVFLVDLARHIQVPVTLDFLAVSSYGAST
ncbi:MAG: phosphoribosyltransferase family protein, partial [Dehalococcoidia bacterium]|nr:phosphoribosyltransferase family protein [Dehalococcoidia bacterium]